MTGLATLVSVLLIAGAEQPTLIALELGRVGDATAAEVEAVDAAVAQRLTKLGVYQVLTHRDVSTLLGVERQRQLLGCSEDSGACFAELAGALNARYVLSGQLNRLGGTYQLTLQVLDSQRGQPVGRTLKAARSVDELLRLVPWAVADVTGTPPPRAPSRLGPALLLAAGGLAAAAGGVVAINAFTLEGAVLRELESGAADPQVLRSAAGYRAEAAEVARGKTLGLGLLLAGGAAIAAGVTWWLLTPDAPGLAFFFAPGGGALIAGGRFP